MFGKGYFAGAYFVPVYFPPVISTSPEPLPYRDALSYGYEPSDYLERDDEEFVDFLAIFLFALEEA
jgi:hypothetical protein